MMREWGGERGAASCAATPPRWDSDERRVGYAESVLRRACECGNVMVIDGHTIVHANRPHHGAPGRV